MLKFSFNLFVFESVIFLLRCIDNENTKSLNAFNFLFRFDQYWLQIIKFDNFYEGCGQLINRLLNGNVVSQENIASPGT
jgi:hypothetical protein